MTYKDGQIDLGFNFCNSYRNLPEIFYTVQDPSYVASPKMAIFNDDLARELGLDIDNLDSDQIAKVLSGHTLPEGASPLAQAYSGHQFGYFTMLGDGRAILLGEHMKSDNKRVDIQLKGSGRTKYSRGGDGKASLGPMLREYIISEAMHSLGIPSTRSLAVVETGEKVIREKPLKGAILTRVGSSHIRVGTFQYAAEFGSEDDLRKLADYTIKRHFNPPNEISNPYIYLLDQVIKRQAELISKWQLVGFIHGVMNTDNMAISGETIDYGPCAFMDIYNPGTVFSSIDRGGRYAYNKQGEIALWNLSRFSESLLPLINKNTDKAIEIVKESLSEFPKLYGEHWLSGMTRKLGIFNKNHEDINLIEELLSLMEKYKADFTNTFLAITFNKDYDLELLETIEYKDWHKKWESRIKLQEKSEEEILKLMKDNNPSVIPRNHKVEEALDKCINNEDYTLFEDLLEVLSNPFEHTRKQNEYQKPATNIDEPYVTYCGT